MEENQKSEAEKLADAAKPESLLFHEAELQKARGKANRFKALYDAAQEKINEYELREEAWFQVQERDEPLKIHAHYGKSSDEAVAVTMWSDWHVEESVDPKSIDGLNEYNPNIAEARVQNLLRNTIFMLDKERSAAKIDQLVLALLGDFITGFIHDELIETNYMHPTEAQRFAKRLIIGGIEYLLDKGRLTKIHIPCCFGNHGRTTKRYRVKTGAKNSWEWLMYMDLADYFRNEERVQFQIATGGIIYSTILGYKIRWLHGNQVRYNGGVGGVYIPLNKAIHKWNEGRDSYVTCLGHWHNLQFLPNAVINGSVIGINEYGIEEVKAKPEPPMQALFLIAKEYGRVCQNMVFA